MIKLHIIVSSFLESNWWTYSISIIFSIIVIWITSMIILKYNRSRVQRSRAILITHIKSKIIICRTSKSITSINWSIEISFPYLSIICSINISWLQLSFHTTLYKYNITWTCFYSSFKITIIFSRKISNVITFIMPSTSWNVSVNLRTWICL